MAELTELGLRVGKIISTHINYRSRAAERDEHPARPRFLVKPGTTLSRSGDPVLAPAEARSIGFEGEIALVIGRTARGLSPTEAWSHVSHIAPANDWVALDARATDGPGARVKGWDTSSSIGELVEASTVDPRDIPLRTWVDGALRQDDNSGATLFSFGDLLAELTALMTLEPGDLVLSGTPAGSAELAFGSTVRVRIGDSAQVENELGHAPYSSALVAAPAAEPVFDPAELAGLSVPSLTFALEKLGVRSTYLTGLQVLRPDRRMLGRAITLRMIPMREDRREHFATTFNAQRAAMDAVGPGDVLVVDGRSDPGGALLGDLAATRLLAQGAAGFVTDGAVRDVTALREVGLPVFHNGVQNATFARVHLPGDTGRPVACAGVLVETGDIVVGDSDGVVVVPPTLAAEVAAAAREMELADRFALERLRAGDLDGIFPLKPHRRADFEAWRAGHDGDHPADLPSSPHPGTP